MITGREIREEYHTPSFDLLGGVRARRLKWAGQLLRAEESFLPRRVALTELDQTEGQGNLGGIFQDAPKGVSMETLIAIAKEKKAWAALVRDCWGTRRSKRARIILFSIEFLTLTRFSNHHKRPEHPGISSCRA